jgi:hypothetical protein
VICHGRNQRRAPHEQLKEGADNSFLQTKRNAPALRPGLIDGGSAIGGWGAGPDPPSVLMFLHCEVSNKRKSVVRRSYPLTIFLVSSSGVGQVPRNDPGRTVRWSQRATNPPNLGDTV